MTASVNSWGRAIGNIVAGIDRWSTGGRRHDAHRRQRPFRWQDPSFGDPSTRSCYWPFCWHSDLSRRKFRWAVLAGILITVGIGIVDTKGLGHVRRAPRGDAAVMLTVFGLTVFVDLMWAVAVGMVMASMILLKRLSDIDPATHSPLIDIAAHRPWIPDLEMPQEVLEGIYVVEIHGSLFFGNAGPLQRKLGGMKDARAVVLHMGDVRYLDQSGVYALSDLISEMTATGTKIYITELHEEPQDLLARLGVAPGAVTEDHIFDRAEDAIVAATQSEGVRLASSPMENI